MKVVEKLPAEELSEDLENAVAKHRTAHIDHRKGDLDHAREEAHRALKKANGREDKIRRMGGRPGEGIERAQRAAKHAVEIVENLEPKDLVDNDQPLQNAYDLVEQARNML